MSKLDMEKVAESFTHVPKHRDLKQEVVLLWVVHENVKPKQKAQVEAVYDCLRGILGMTHQQVLDLLDTESIPQQQVKVYIMCSGGMLGRFAAEQPGEFYIDDRVPFVPSRRKKIEKEVGHLVSLMEAKGLDTKRGEVRMPWFHNCGLC